MSDDPILEIRDLRKSFRARRGGRAYEVKAVDGVSLAVRRGEVLGIVGESGCGKTTLGRIVMRLERADAGQVVFDGRDLPVQGRRDLRAARLRIRMIFQDSSAALDPRRSVGDSVAETGDIHRVFENRHDRAARIAETLERVGLDASFAERHPHELSGGQRQRVGIARAILPAPDLIIADEPVSALDVSVQAQVLNLLADLKARLGLTMMFISHDLGVVAKISDRVVVLYMGTVAEVGAARALFAEPAHPYTALLISAIPRPDSSDRVTGAAEMGEPPSRFRQIAGCPFRDRCPKRTARCEAEAPMLRAIAPDRMVSCHNV